MVRRRFHIPYLERMLCFDDKKKESAIARLLQRFQAAEVDADPHLGKPLIAAERVNVEDPDCVEPHGESLIVFGFLLSYSIVFLIVNCLLLIVNAETWIAKQCSSITKSQNTYEIAHNGSTY